MDGGWLAVRGDRSEPIGDDGAILVLKDSVHLVEELMYVVPGDAGVADSEMLLRAVVEGDVVFAKDEKELGFCADDKVVTLDNDMLVFCGDEGVVGLEDGEVLVLCKAEDAMMLDVVMFVYCEDDGVVMLDTSLTGPRD